MKLITFYQSNGVLAVVTPSEPQQPGETEQAYLDRIAAKTVPEGTAYSLLDRSQFPASREHRPAWKLAGATVVVDSGLAAIMDTARAENRDPVKAVLDALAEG